MVQLLLINGANPECKNLQGSTALDMAREEEFKLLVGFGAEGSSSFTNYIPT
jgi:ankyrin repeat protein